MNRIFFVAAMLLLTACTAPIQHNTASGRPERQFAAPPDVVRAALVTEMVNRGYTISQETQSMVVGQKLSDNVAANMLMGTGMRPQVTVRASFTMIATGGGTRVVGDIAVVQNEGTAFERAIPQTNARAAADMQAAMDAIPL
jgi:predicted trehalose synthase